MPRRATSIAASPDTLYISDQSTIYKLSPGSAPTPLLSNLNNPRKLHYLPGALVWMEGDRLRRVPLDTLAPEELQTLPPRVGNMALSSPQFVFYTGEEGLGSPTQAVDGARDAGLVEPTSPLATTARSVVYGSEGVLYEWTPETDKVVRVMDFPFSTSALQVVPFGKQRDFLLLWAVFASF